MDERERALHPYERYDAWISTTIRRYGWALQAVLGDEEGPPFVYTVGLSGLGHPELIVFAVNQATAARVLNGLGAMVREGVRLQAGERVRLADGGVSLIGFPESELWLLEANSRYRGPDGPPVSALLVVLEDGFRETPGADRECVFC